jgi:hypothetical protein
MDDKRAIRFERSSYLPEQVARVISNLIILTLHYSSYSPSNLSLGIKVNPFKRKTAYSEVIQMKSLKNEQILFRPVYRMQ